MNRQTILGERPAVAVTSCAAAHLVLSEPHGTSLVATAVAAPSDMYASIRWPGMARLTRLHGTRQVWRQIRAEFDNLAIGQPVANDSSLWRLLFPDHTQSYRLVCVGIETITALPHELAMRIDERV